MFENSILKKTGQWWRFVSGAAFTSSTGFLLMLYKFSGLEFSYWANPILISLPISILGLAILWAGIKCPKCRVQWIWKYFSDKQMTGGMTGLLGSPTCPYCATDFSQPHAMHQVKSKEQTPAPR